MGHGNHLGAALRQALSRRMGGMPREMNTLLDRLAARQE
jgi:hypothetical protein